MKAVSGLKSPVFVFMALFDSEYREFVVATSVAHSSL